MPDTPRTLAALQALLADNATADISAQDVRDFLVSVFPQTTKGDLPGIDATGIIGRLPATTDGFVLTLDAAEAFGFKWAAAGAGAHPDLATHDALGLATDAVFEEMDNDIAALKLPDYLVGTATATLSGEIVVGTSPGGELGGTWASPTVDATHSGSAHHTTHDSDDVAYIPTTAADWGPAGDPGDVEQALDVLADRTSKVMVWIPAKDLIPSYDRAAYTGVPGVNTEPTNDYAWRGLAFSGTVKQFAAGDFPLPPNYDASTLTYRVRWRHITGSGTGDVVWGMQMLALSDDDASDAAMGTAIEVTDTILTANDFHRSAMSAAVTPAGTAAAGDHIFFEFYRDGAAAGDTNASAQWLIGIEVYYGLTAAGVA